MSFACVANRKCSDGERMALLYDYVGAVYGKNPSARYDGVLTSEEERYAKDTFGLLTPSDVQENFFVYLSKARSSFLRRVASSRFDPECEKLGNFRQRFTHPLLGEGVVFSGHHWCGEQYGRKFAEFELEIAAHPEEWAFFMEGVSSPFANLSDESGLIHKIATALNIPVHEAVMQPDDTRLLAEMKRRFGTTPVDMAVTLCFVQLFLIDKIQEGDPSKSESSIELSTKAHAELFKLNVHEVQLALLKFVQPPPGEDMVHHFVKRAFEVKHVITDYYAVIANELTPPLIEERLRSSGKKKALFLFGDAHLPIVQTVYSGGANPLRADPINVCGTETKVEGPVRRYIEKSCFEAGVQNISSCIEAVSKRIVSEVEKICSENARPEAYIVQCTRALLSAPWPNTLYLEEEVLPKMEIKMPKVLRALTSTHMMHSPDGRGHRGLQTMIESSARYYREGVLGNDNCMIDVSEK